MMSIACADVESRRLEIQLQLDALKNAYERNQWGQFATPPRLASEMVAYAAEHLEGREIRFLEPALGSGSFFSAIMRSPLAARIVSATGIELDPGFADASRTLWSQCKLEVVEADFTRVEPNESFNLVITNPPYVRHHHLGADEKTRLQRDALRMGIQISGLAGLYCHFILKAHSWLEAGALSLWLVPTEFLDVNYGVALKNYLTRSVRLLHIHRFDAADVQFADALVSSAILVFRNSSPEVGHSVIFSRGGRLGQPESTELVPLDQLDPESKWSRFGDTKRNGYLPASGGPTLGDIFTIRRGIATGCNRFFILPLEKALELGIPRLALRPMLPSPRHLGDVVIEGRADGYPDTDAPLAVIDCNLDEGRVQEQYPMFWQYLLRGKESGVLAGYLASRRAPWYSQERRAPAPFLCTYMGRQQTGQKPFRFIWNKSEATATNLYLMLYPRGMLKEALAESPQLSHKVFSALNSTSSEALVMGGRVYGGGLHKMEPGELSRMDASAVLEAAGITGRQAQLALFEKCRTRGSRMAT